MRHKQQRLLEQNIQYLGAYIKEYNLRNITPESIILSITEADPDQGNFWGRATTHHPADPVGHRHDQRGTAGGPALSRAAARTAGTGGT